MAIADPMLDLAESTAGEIFALVSSVQGPCIGVLGSEHWTFGHDRVDGSGAFVGALVGWSFWLLFVSTPDRGVALWDA